jgi:hypothetical protein
MQAFWNFFYEKNAVGDLTNGNFFNKKYLKKLACNVIYF